MTTHELESELTRLEEEKHQWELRLNTLERADGDSSGDFGDQGKEAEYLGDRRLRMLLIRKKIADLNDEIDLVKSGYVRTCLKCSRAISLERLKIVPNAQLCGDCQKNEDEKRTKRTWFPTAQATLYPRALPLAG